MWMNMDDFGNVQRVCHDFGKMRATVYHLLHFVITSAGAVASVATFNDIDIMLIVNHAVITKTGSQLAKWREGRDFEEQGAVSDKLKGKFSFYGKKLGFVINVFINDFRGGKERDCAFPLQTPNHHYQ